MTNPVPPLDLRPVWFETPLVELDSPVVVESEDGTVWVLETRGRQGNTLKLRLTRSGSVPQFVAAPGQRELGDLLVLELPSRPVRAFRLPDGKVVEGFPASGVVLARVCSVTLLASVVAVAAGTQAWRNGVQLIALILLAAILLAATVFVARLPGAKARYATESGSYLLPELLDSRPAASAAVALVDSIKEEYGRLLSDLVYRIEAPAFFDPADELTRQFTTALIRWDTASETLDQAELGALAAEIRVAFDAAKAHAETVGLAHLPAEAQEPAGRALKAARLAAGAKSPGERDAAQRQVVELLESLALYYLPRPAQARRMIEGGVTLALPGRRRPEETS
ncbi:MAG: hypothetical protein Q4D79_05580 [Propionibacteriaceae bacterium]|nr:hypothetical protein [Propionibacteriaceae bacterium]